MKRRVEDKTVRNKTEQPERWCIGSLRYYTTPYTRELTGQVPSTTADAIVTEASGESRGSIAESILPVATETTGVKP